MRLVGLIGRVMVIADMKSLSKLPSAPGKLSQEPPDALLMYQDLQLHNACGGYGPEPVDM